jgi:hypothetical protein
MVAKEKYFSQIFHFKVYDWAHNYYKTVVVHFRQSFQHFLLGFMQFFTIIFGEQNLTHPFRVFIILSLFTVINALFVR